MGGSLTDAVDIAPIERAVAAAEVAYAFGDCLLFPKRRQLLVGSKPVSIGSRAFDALVILIEAEGELVTKNELLKRVWHSTTVEEKNISAQIAAIRKALGNGRELVKTDAGNGYRFTGYARRIVGEPEASSPTLPAIRPAQSPAAATNLPVPLSPLVGRERELHELVDQVATHRLITLTGAGGIGKTQLALEVGRLALPRFSDGAWMVELSPLQRIPFTLKRNRHARKSCCILEG